MMIKTSKEKAVDIAVERHSTIDHVPHDNKELNVLHKTVVKEGFNLNLNANDFSSSLSFLHLCKL